MKYCISFFIFSILAIHAKASDTLKINLQQADSIFLINNFYLLASTMNIEAQKAKIIQAKLYPNPVFTGEINAYDPENNKVLHTGQTGQKSFQFEQLILLGGKRKAEIEMAKTNALIAELQFQQMVRQLKFRLHSDLFAAGQQQLLLLRYNSQLRLLDTLLNSYQIQADKGNIPLKDVVRLKGAYLKLNNDRAELLKQHYETQTSLGTLLQTYSFVEFHFSEQEIKKYIKPDLLSDIRKEALLSRPELLLTQQEEKFAAQYLQYQKESAIPDINLFASYDQRSGAFNNQVNMGVSVPLPLWNKNKGNIRFSEYKLKEAGYNVNATQNEIINNLQNNHAFYVQTVLEYQKATSLYNQDFEITVKGMSYNFRKQNVSIIEFIDFFEAYNEVLTELTRIKTQLVVSAEQLNLIIGKDIY